jgi:hypothetical protein
MPGAQEATHCCDQVSLSTRAPSPEVRPSLGPATPNMQPQERSGQSGTSRAEREALANRPDPAPLRALLGASVDDVTLCQNGLAVACVAASVRQVSDAAVQGSCPSLYQPTTPAIHARAVSMLAKGLRGQPGPQASVRERASAKGLSSLTLGLLKPLSVR